CSSLSSVEIGNSVTTIGSGAFKSCSKLGSIDIPASVTSIFEEVFVGCTKLTAINVAEGNTVYSSLDGVLFDKAREVLYTCPAGREGQYTIPSSVITIPENAFYGCAALSSIEIPSSVTTIGNLAFSQCNSLVSINIPASVTTLGRAVFFGSTRLTAINVAEGNEVYSSLDGVVFDKSGEVLYLFPTGREGHYAVPSSATKIGINAFSGSVGLTSVEIPESVTEIGERAFLRSNALTSVELPSSVTSVGEYAFAGCEALTEVTLGSSMTSVSSYMFTQCPTLTSVKIPDSVTEIGEGAFSYCPALTSVKIPSSITVISKYAFYECVGLTSVEIPSAVTEIGSEAFENCYGLTSVYYGAETLIKADGFVFMGWEFDIYYNATLYVRESALPQAETVTPWCLFMHREAYNFDSAVADIAADTIAPVEVYTLSGVKVATSTDALPTGVY
ncbi:MAG: leucine-rich repeat domain-containing protein, partial [Muribaculaceae bacterium]|nr:leucine-rich repeat domain-containing protein [Muribaculaceae bacterium]